MGGRQGWRKEKWVKSKILLHFITLLVCLALQLGASLHSPTGPGKGSGPRR